MTNYALLISAAAAALGISGAAVTAHALGSSGAADTAHSFGSSGTGEASAENERVPRVPVSLFAGEPRGSYGTGTFEISWIDESRDALRTRDPHDKHRVLVQVWYPAAQKRDGIRAPYILSPERRAPESAPGYVARDGGRWGNWRTRAGWPDDVDKVLTNSVIDAPVAGNGSRFPVLIYNHGGGQPQFAATFQTEFLASHGYVVVAIGHSGFNGVNTRRFSDGYVYSFDADAPLSREEDRRQLSDEQAEKMSLRERAEWKWRYDSLASVGPEAVRNVSFVLDRLEAANANPRHPLHDRLDLERVGIFGFSWGGSVSVRAGLEEPRVKAVINQDGGPWGLLGEAGETVKRIARPMMIMSNSEDWPSQSNEAHAVKASWQEQRNAMALHYWTLLTHSSNDWYWVRLANSEHYDFSDRPLFSPRQGADDPGHIHPRLAHAIINQYVLEFFDKYLRDRKDTPLLSGSRRYEEASLQRSSE